ncbi:mechanosensitive ion channel domain-containing protein [Candidatus Riflebacteria bacterium]
MGINLLIFIILLCFQLPLNAQSNKKNETVSDKGAVASPTTVVQPAVSTLVPKAASLASNFKTLPDMIAKIQDVTVLEKNLTTIKEKIKKVENRLTTLKSSMNYGFDQIAELKVSARQIADELKDLLQLCSERLDLAAKLKDEWNKAEKEWINLEKTIEKDVETVKPIFKQSNEQIHTALKLLSGIANPLIAFQQVVTKYATENSNNIEALDQMLKVIRNDFFKKSGPAVLTPAFFVLFHENVTQEALSGLKSLQLPDRKFFLASGWIILFQILLALFVIVILHTLSKKSLERLRLQFIIKSPYATGLLVGMMAFYPLYSDPPKTWIFFLWILGAFSAANLFTGLIVSWRRIILVYLLTFLFLFSRLLMLISFPLTLHRIYVTIIGFFGGIVCYWLSAKNDDKYSWLYSIVYKIVGSSFMLIFLTQASGFVALANHLLDATIKIIFLGLLAWVMQLIITGVAEAVLINPFTGKSKFFAKHSEYMARQMEWLVNIIIVFVAFCWVLSIIGIYESFSFAASGILSIGIRLKGLSLTVGLVIAAAATLYTALILSWLLQRIFEEELYPRFGIESGVGISINRLIQYGLFILGFFVSFSVLGINFENFAVLIGALGVGIGFGLQNIVNNFASGLILLFERSIKVGDVVVINGEWGEIKSLGLRSTIVQTFNYAELIVPNSELVSNSVTNWTLSNRLIRIIIPVGVAYGSDIPLVIKSLRDVATENRMVLDYPAPQVLFLAFGDSSLNCELRVWIGDINNMLNIKNQLNCEIDNKFREKDITIPFPQRDVHLQTDNDK